MIVKRLFLFIFSMAFCAVQLAQANVGDAFGFGSRTMALGGAGGTLAGGSTAVYHNPAILGAQEGSRFQFNYGFIYVQPSFIGINNVVTQNSYVADGVSTGNVDVTYKPTVGQSLSFAYRLFPDTMNFTVGMLTFLPFNQAAFMDSGETYVPEYFLYRARTQRPQIEIGAGGMVLPGLSFGVGMHTAFTLAGAATAFINSSTTSTSTLRFTSTLTPRLAPYVGLYLAPSQARWKISSVFRMPAASDATIAMKSSARILSPVAAPNFNVTSTSALYYDPMALELGGAIEPLTSVRFVAQVDYQIWNQFVPSALAVTQTAQDLQGSLVIAPGVVPALNYVNIVVPRVGTELNLSDLTVLRAGYFYRPSILGSVPNGVGNYLDPAKHGLNVGVGFQFPHISGFENPLQLDVTLTYHSLVPFTVVKTAGSESGSTTESKIGSPGYQAGGSLFGGALSLAMTF